MPEESNHVEVHSYVPHIEDRNSMSLSWLDNYTFHFFVDRNRRSDSLIDMGCIRSMTQILIGKKVWLADAPDRKRRVATGTVLEVGANGRFHNRPIPPQHVRINLEHVVMNIPLMVPVDEADQVLLADAMGSSVLWPKDLTFSNE